MLPTADRATAPLAKRQSKTPPKYANFLGVGVNKILEWIASGELRAINVATRPDGRPRYIIPPEEQERFERSRASVPAAPAPPGRVRRQSPGVKEFF